MHIHGCNHDTIDGDLHKLIKGLKMQVHHVNPHPAAKEVYRVDQGSLVLAKGFTCDDLAVGPNLKDQWCSSLGDGKK